MRKASSVFYLITGIASLIGFILLVIFGILSFTSLPTAANEDEYVTLLGGGITMCIYAVIEIFAMIIGFHGHKLNKHGSTRIGFHIFSIVLGVIAEPFLILAGIFGVVGANQK